MHSQKVPWAEEPGPQAVQLSEPEWEETEPAAQSVQIEEGSRCVPGGPTAGSRASNLLRAKLALSKILQARTVTESTIDSTGGVSSVLNCRGQAVAVVVGDIWIWRAEKAATPPVMCCEGTPTMLQMPGFVEAA